MSTSILQSPYPINLTDVFERVQKKSDRAIRLCNRKSLISLFGISKYNFRILRNKFGEEIIRIDGDIPVDLEIHNADKFLFVSYDQSDLTHGLHKYPAKFFPALPRWIIKKYSQKGDFVLDPFAGSGTTNIEALLLNRKSAGIDIDPFSRFLAKVKTTPLDEKPLVKAQKKILSSIKVYNPKLISLSDIPDFPYRDNWFNKEILYELAYIKKNIGLLNCNNNIKNYFKICFSSIIRAVSNADNNCTRTVIRKKLNKQINPGDALKKFAEVVLFNTPKVIKFCKKINKNMETIIPEGMDARRINFKNNTFDLAVTSPPYVNAVDYPRTHQLEMYWLGLVKGSLTPLKKKHVGTESVAVNDYKHLHLFGISKIDEIIKKIFLKDPRRAYIAYKYLYDMKLNLIEVHRVLKKNGKYVMVVGNNKIRGVLFENWKYIMKLSSEIGFKSELYFGSEIIKHFIKVPRTERINTDWVIVLKK